MQRRKNFNYGELWQSDPVLPTAAHRELIDPAKLTSNTAFLDYLAESNYKVYLDYGYTEYAHTSPSEKEIVLNANYSDEMLSSFLQHELGHLMLFNVNQFVTFGDSTLRSIISDVVYTVDNIEQHGLAKLFRVENIIQDIIIETVSYSDCVCHTGIVNIGSRIGVKHMDKLESVQQIAIETCEELLKPLPEGADRPPLEGPADLVSSMRVSVLEDARVIERKLKEAIESKKFAQEVEYVRFREIYKVQEKLDQTLKRIHAKSGMEPSKAAKLIAMRDKFLAQLKELKSSERIEKDNSKAAIKKDKAINKLKGQLEQRQALAELLGRVKTTGDEVDAEAVDDGGLSVNNTDHLLEDEFEESNPDEVGHSYDCGFPYPVTVSRNESIKHESHIKTISTRAGVRKLHLKEDDSTNVVSNRVPIPERETTYFKSNKREFIESDMLKGKRRLRASGVNVLIGLDISGSMTNEWTNMLFEISATVEKLKETLDIENIVYFTYNQRLQEHSKDMDDLTLKASGGNAFGYVYQDVMKTLPMMQKNEIILITDCGDNLGFPLDSACTAERNGSLIRNHISIVDTENAGFYNASGLSKEEWSLHRFDDQELHNKIADNIEQLIDLR